MSGNHAHRDSHWKEVAPLTQGLNYRSAGDRELLVKTAINIKFLVKEICISLFTGVYCFYIEAYIDALDWCLRRIMNIHWSEFFTDDEIRSRTG